MADNHLTKICKIDGLLEELEQLKEAISKKKAHARNKFESIDTSAKDLNVQPLNTIKLSSARFLRGHIGKVHDLVWSKDDYFLVSVAQDGCVILWDARNGYINNMIEASSIQPLTLDMSEDSCTIFCGGLSANAAIFKKRPSRDSDTYSEFEFSMQLDHESRLTCCKYMGSNQLLTAAESEGCCLWDTEAASKINTFQGHISGVLCMQLLPGNKTFLTGSCDATIKLWDMRKKPQNCTQTFEGHESDVTTLAVFPDDTGNYFVSGSDDTWACLYDIRSDNLVARYSDPLWREIDPSREGFDNIEIQRPEPPSVCSVCLSKSGRILFTGCKDGVIYCYDLLNPVNHIAFREESGPISQLAMAHGGYGLASAVWDVKNRIRLWIPS